MKELYHGTTALFDEIDLDKCKGYKDFGKGFYATAVPSHAERIAVRNRRIMERRQELLKKKGNIKVEPVFAYRYNLIYSEDTNGLSVKMFDKADTEWLRFIIMNRKCETYTHEYDIVIGPTADAETTTIINDYLEALEESEYAEEICQEVIDNLKPENLPKQYFFRTKNAINTLKFNTVKRQMVM